MPKVNANRVHQLNSVEYSSGKILYWMSRDQRLFDNWSVLFAAEKAIEYQQQLEIVFCLQPSFAGATLRQYDFMLKGLEELHASAAEKKIPFSILEGEMVSTLTSYIEDQNIGLVVTDFSSLVIGREWRKQLAENIHVPFYEVDTHNVVPVWEASEKQEYAARTIRPKIHKKLDQYLTGFPNSLLDKLSHQPSAVDNKVDISNLQQRLKVDTSVQSVDWIQPGEEAAHQALKDFISDRLPGYDQLRNDPTEEHTSRLSPYLHYGHLAAQRIALEVKKSDASKEDKEAYLEELIVRKELSDNFCYYNQQYQSVTCFPNWALQTLSEHKSDPREHIYTQKEFEAAKTHDQLWNAAQLQLTTTGTMHGYMRMYWAKKILEWTKYPEQAMEIAIYLNDKYQLDGRDPNGYVGIAWSIGGVHDRAWFEREIFGKVRYMSRSGCERKFDVDAYIKTWTQSKDS